MKLKLTKYPKLNLLILKTIEVPLLCLAPFWAGKLSDWLYVRTSCAAFKPIGDTVVHVWLNGIFFICYLVGGAFLCFLIVVGMRSAIEQNMEWAKKLAWEDNENSRQNDKRDR